MIMIISLSIEKNKQQNKKKKEGTFVTWVNRSKGINSDLETNGSLSILSLFYRTYQTAFSKINVAVILLLVVVDLQRLFKSAATLVSPYQRPYGLKRWPPTDLHGNWPQHPSETYVPSPSVRIRSKPYPISSPPPIIHHPPPTYTPLSSFLYPHNVNRHPSFLPFFTWINSIRLYTVNLGQRRIQPIEKFHF